MDIEKLIENAKVCCGDIETEDCSRYCIDPRDSRDSGLRWCRQWLIHDLHTALSTLQDELDVMTQRNHENLGMCRIWERRYSELQAENEKLLAELEQVKRERAAAVEDVAAIIGDVEEIRRGYDVENADADGAFAELCKTYCANKGRSCYVECEKYHCKNFKWRGIQKED